MQKSRLKEINIRDISLEPSAALIDLRYGLNPLEGNICTVGSNSVTSNSSIDIGLGNTGGAGLDSIPSIDSAFNWNAVFGSSFGSFSCIADHSCAENYRKLRSSNSEESSQIPFWIYAVGGWLQQNFHATGAAPNTGLPRFERSYAQGTGPAWNGQLVLQQQPSSPVYGAQRSGLLPPPLWEVQAPDSSPVAGAQYPQSMVTQVSVTHGQPQGPQHMRSDQMVGMYIQPITTSHLSAINNKAVQGNWFAGFHPQSVLGAQYMDILSQQMASMYP
ncbi:TOM1-like protein 8 [Durio zibethinus]|uniref:TOM1-like protein 8 n=1 Tax=Durio zibethinus TaxID=66656 RepID=A0A6P6AH49_DURZI|nr:TOM1-like protein 8 [Durio zibethinus]